MTATNARRRVWIVDDSPLDAERARAALAASYDIEVFQDGSTVLERLTSVPPPDVLVLDWVMPGISGPEVCRFLRAQGDNNLPIGILLLTVHRAVEQIVEGLSAGANDYLAKPYEPEELQARVMTQLRARELLERATLAERINQGLLESAPDAMLALDLGGRITFANAEACRVFACAAEQLRGRRIDEVIPAWNVLPPRNASEAAQALPDIKFRDRIFSPTNRLGLSTTSAFTISLRDVTERRAADARRLDFYSIVAHDLRSPLSTIGLRTELILSGARGQLPETVASDLRKIQSNLNTLAVMINDFLAMASVDNAPISVERKTIDVVALLDATVQEVQPLLDSGNLTWQRSIIDTSDAYTVAGDPNRLTQVFNNLVSNAIKFTPPQGTITTEVRRIDDKVQISVADTGRGIEASALPTLFDRYTRANSGDHAVPGSGLGLMIVREIVLAHGGTVGVDSEPGKGSRFWLQLPAVRVLDSQGRTFAVAGD